MQPGVLTVRAFAKINLSLEVLNKRPDGFHNLRTIFQTISLHDVIGIAVSPGEQAVTLESDLEIPGENLIVRAARAVLAETGVSASVHFRLEKRIPMGGGLGGGSTDAAAVLLALPGLLGCAVPLPRLMEIATALGSDIPFFLVGGTAAGLGRGTELYPMPDAAGGFGLLVLPDVHVSTPDAFRSLNRGEAPPPGPQVSLTEQAGLALAAGDPSWAGACVNDFESAVFARHPLLADLRSQLESAGASPARMTGSGAALFGLFPAEAQRDQAAARITAARPVPFELLTRQEYRQRRFASPTGQ